MRFSKITASPLRLGLWCAALAAAAGTVLVLYRYDPEQGGFYPLCPLYLTTGWSCPGCGTLRALHQLTHGHWAAAWRLNPLTVSLLPVALWLGLRLLVLQLFGRSLPGLVTHPIFVWALAAIFVLFGIGRNL